VERLVTVGSAVVAAGIIGLAFFFTLSPGASWLSLGSSSPPPFSSLGGVDYQPDTLCSCPSGSIAPPISTFPMLHQSGWNLIKVYLGWNTLESDPTYVNTLEQIASEAQSNGLYVIYTLGDGNQGTGANCNNTVWPCGVVGSYCSTTLNQCETAQFWNDLWSDSIQYEGTDIWSAEWQHFWTPIINATESNPSTLGYELMNEPRNKGGAPLSEIQKYNQFFATRISSVIKSNQVVIFMGTCPSCGYDLNATVPETEAPTGIYNLAIDFHDYLGQPSVSQQDQYFAYYSNVGKYLHVPVLIGEWGACSLDQTCDPNGVPISQTQATQNIQTAESNFQQYGFANTYFAWQVANDVSPNGGNLLKLLNQNQQEYWVDSAIIKYQSFNGSCTCTSTTSSTSSSTNQTVTNSSSSTSTQPQSTNSSSFSSPIPTILSLAHSTFTFAQENLAAVMALIIGGLVAGVVFIRRRL
jgi:hypothetical protein